MELINIYDNKRRKTEKIVKRNSKKNKNEYDLSIQIWIMNDNEEIILTKRNNNKYTYPNLWECTEGVVDFNETSLEAAIREVKEELGIDIFPNEIVKLKIDKEKEYPKYTDIYLCRKNVLLSEIKLQKEEYQDVKIVNEKEYNLMCKNNELIPYLNYFYDIYKKNLKYGIIDLQNKVFINENKKYLKGNLHTHTTKSDGKNTLKEVVDIYNKKDYNFLAITDHDVFCNDNINDDFVLLHGIEVSCIYKGNNELKGKYTHFNCFMPYKNNSNKIYYYNNITELQKDLNELNQNYKLIQFNHPLFSRFLDNEFINIENYNLIEIYNHKDFLEETGMQNAEQIVRTLLNNHKRVFVTAGDDFHGSYEKKNNKCFGGYIMVEAKNNEIDILNAIKSGKFYASTGPKILDYRIEGRVLKIKTVPVSNIIFYSNMRKCKNIFSKDNAKITQGEYILQGEEYYIWTKVIDENGKMAWTQPIFIDNTSYF